MAHILIIDDEPPIRMMLRMLCEAEQHTVDEASDGAEAMKRYKERQPDLIITDLIMPGKEGLETITTLRKEDPEVKIIAISGGGKNNPEGYLKTAKLLGAKEAFEKPIRKETMLSAIRKYV